MFNKLPRACWLLYFTFFFTHISVSTNQVAFVDFNAKAFNGAADLALFAFKATFFAVAIASAFIDFPATTLTEAAANVGAAV